MPITIRAGSESFPLNIIPVQPNTNAHKHRLLIENGRKSRTISEPNSNWNISIDIKSTNPSNKLSTILQNGIRIPIIIHAIHIVLNIEPPPYKVNPIIWLQQYLLNAGYHTFYIILYISHLIKI